MKIRVLDMKSRAVARVKACLGTKKQPLFKRTGFPGPERAKESLFPSNVLYFSGVFAVNFQGKNGDVSFHEGP